MFKARLIVRITDTSSAVIEPALQHLIGYGLSVVERTPRATQIDLLAGVDGFSASRLLDPESGFLKPWYCGSYNLKTVSDKWVNSNVLDRNPHCIMSLPIAMRSPTLEQLIAVIDEWLHQPDLMRGMGLKTRQMRAVEFFRSFS